MPEICLIVAMDKSNAIGFRGAMPWHLPADLAHFKATTLGSPIIMGRLTYESIGRPLPGRHNLVVSRREDWNPAGVEVCASLQEAIDAASTDRADLESGRIFVIGGGQIYRAALELATELIVTHVDTHAEHADTWFPEIDPDRWIEVERRNQSADDRNAYAMTFVRYRCAPEL